MSESPCNACEKRPTCTVPCERLEKELPGVDAGKLQGEVLLPSDNSALLDWALRQDRRPDKIQEVRDWLDTLPDELRSLAERYWWHGETQDEIAAALGITQPAVHYRLRKIRKAHL